MYDPYADFQKFVLPNGLTVYASQWPGREWQAMEILVHAGHLQDPLGKSGTAHLVEHLVGENGETSKRDFKRWMNECGIRYNLGITCSANTLYKYFFPIREDVSLLLLRKMATMYLLSLPAQCFEREQQIIIQESPEKIPFQQEIERRHSEGHLKGTPYANNVSLGGVASTIQSITPDDVQRFFRQYYVPANITIGTLGGMPVSEVIDRLNQSPFGQILGGARVPDVRPLEEFPPLVDPVWSPTWREWGLTCNRCEYARSARIPSRINSIIVDVFTSMLHGALFEALREQRAWLYRIDVDIVSSIRSFRLLQIFSPDPKEECLTELDGVIDDVLRVLSDDQQALDRKKFGMIMGMKLFDSNGRTVLSGVMENVRYGGRIVTTKEWCDQVSAVTLEDIREVAAWCFTEQCQRTFVRP